MPASTRERSPQLWRRTLPDSIRPSVALSTSLRNIQAADTSALGLLFFAAVQATIDDGGQTETQYALKGYGYPRRSVWRMDLRGIVDR